MCPRKRNGLEADQAGDFTLHGHVPFTGDFSVIDFVLMSLTIYWEFLRSWLER